MALGNPNSNGNKAYESPIKGFANYNVQVYTKGGENVFKVERSFIMNTPNEENFDSEEDYNKAVQEHKKLMAKYEAHLRLCNEKPTEKVNSNFLKRNEKLQSDLEAGDKIVYGSFPVGNVSMIDGYIFNMSQKLDMISKTEKTEKVYFDLVDFDNKEVYRVNSSFSTATRTWIDSLLNLQDLNQKVQFKFEKEMDAKKDFKEPRLDKNGDPIIAPILMSEFRDGYYRKRIKPLYYNYEKVTDKKGAVKFTHKCEEPDASQYQDAIKLAIEDNVQVKIVKFFVEKVNNVLIPRVQREIKPLFGEMGYEVEYSKNERSGFNNVSFKKIGSSDGFTNDSEEYENSNEYSKVSDEDGELPF